MSDSNPYRKPRDRRSTPEKMSLHLDDVPRRLVVAARSKCVEDETTLKDRILQLLAEDLGLTSDGKQNPLDIRRPATPRKYF